MPRERLAVHLASTADSSSSATARPGIDELLQLPRQPVDPVLQALVLGGWRAWGSAAAPIRATDSAA